MPFPELNPALERALTARAYNEPTPVQLAVVEPAAQGRDMLVSAQTGSGKTVAFGLALSGTLLGGAERFERAAEPLALIIAPTRELAMQVQRELAWLYAETGARIATCVGGMDPKAERTALAAGAHIVVGTPGRLRDHLERRRLDLSKLRAVVLDEADEMLDLGFRDDLQFILDETPAERQTLMFSATVPRGIESLARSYQKNALRIETAQRNRQHDDIEYRAIRTVPYAIEPSVVNLLRYFDAPAALVFCATREGVRRMHAALANRGFAAVALSGELSQAERTDALQSLRDGRSKVLVATDVAARGLDLAELTLVIHADLPNDAETLLHRSGRTGRAGRKGISILIVPPNKRRRAEELLSRSRINASWGNAPTAKEIAAKDQERLLALPILDELATAEDLELGRTLLEGRTPEQVAAALIRMHRASLPVPESLKDFGRPAAPERAPRDAGTQRPDARASRDRPDRDERPRHEPAKKPRARVESKGEKEAPWQERPSNDDVQLAQTAGDSSVPKHNGADRSNAEHTSADVAGAAHASPERMEAEPTRHEPRLALNESAQPAIPHDNIAATAVADQVQPPIEKPAHDEHAHYKATKSVDTSDRKLARAEREHRPARSGEEPRARPASRSSAGSTSRGRKENGDMVWFGLSIGRDKNADPRWLLPLICRAGDVTKQEIGTIRITDKETRFEIQSEHADNFANAVKMSKHKEGRIWRIGDEPVEAGSPVVRSAERPSSPERSYAKPEGRPYKSRDAERGGERPFAKSEGRAYKSRDGERGGERPFVKPEGRPYKSRDGERGGERPFAKPEGRPYKSRDAERGGERPFVKPESRPYKGKSPGAAPSSSDRPERTATGRKPFNAAKKPYDGNRKTFGKKPFGKPDHKGGAGGSSGDRPLKRSWKDKQTS